ncbi:MAG: transglycosylase SLT domain-containing protein, partial [Acidobacteria bacterium]|nr:transglycosylase SLT domain-containing protein [Acidobacteriota bacterium]
GILQIKPSTANSLGLGRYTKEQLYDVATNVRLATTYLKNLRDRYNDLYTALAVYKQGPTNYNNKGICTASREYADWITECAERLKSENL